MLFLLELSTEFPPTMPGGDKSDLMARELARGRELAEAGVIRTIHRLPGRLANIAIWSAPGPDELHELVTSLPAWPYMKVCVRALATHVLAERCAGQVSDE